MKNNEKLYNEIYEKIKSEFFFDIELHKYGRTFNSIRKRWAYIIVPDTFGSTKDPAPTRASAAKKKGDVIQFKNKNFALENAKNIAIQPHAASLKDYKADRSKNPVRIVIEFLTDPAIKTKTSEIYLYFENMQNAKQIYAVLLLMRMNLLNSRNPQLIGSLVSLSQKVESAQRFMIFKKIVDVKNLIKAKKIADLEAERLRKQAELDAKNSLVSESNKKQLDYSKKYTLGTKFENLLLDFFKKEENLFTQFGSFAAFKSAKETLRKVFLNKLKSKMPDKYLYSTPAAYVSTVEKKESVNDNEKKVRFKVKRQSMDGIIIRSSGKTAFNNIDYNLKSTTSRNLNLSSAVGSNGNYSNNNNFTAQNLVNISDLAINTKKAMISFGNGKNNIAITENCLSGEDIAQINSVYLHLNEKGAYEENCVLINGPKKDLDKYLKYMP